MTQNGQHQQVRFAPIEMQFAVNPIPDGALLTFASATGIFGVFLSADACKSLAGQLRGAASGLTLPPGAGLPEDE